MPLMGTPQPDPLRSALLRKVPDEPVNVDCRHALLHGGQIFGNAGAAAVVPTSGDYISAIGVPSAADLAAAKKVARPEAEVLAYADNAGSLGCRLGEAFVAFIHTLPAGLNPPARTLPPTELVTADAQDRLATFPERLRKEVAETIDRFPAVIALADGEPASLCYCAAWTETYWDLSIETLEPHQRKGLGEAAARRAIKEMHDRGLNTVWGAMGDNDASLALAKRLGFRQKGELFVFD